MGLPLVYAADRQGDHPRVTPTQPVSLPVITTYRDEIDTGSTKNEQVQNLCALLFNVQGMLHEILK